MNSFADKNEFSGGKKAKKPFTIVRTGSRTRTSKSPKNSPEVARLECVWEFSPSQTIEINDITGQGVITDFPTLTAPEPMPSAFPCQTPQYKYI